MKKMYTAAEIAEMKLPKLPTTKKAILTRAEKEEWHFETRVGLGGIRKVFEIPDLYLPGYIPPNHDDLSQSESTRRFITERAHQAAARTAESLGDRVDPDRLAHAIRYVDNYMATRGIAVSAERRSEIIVVIYNSMRSDFTEEDVNSLLKLVA